MKAVLDQYGRYQEVVTVVGKWRKQETRFLAARPSYCYCGICGICGHVPRDAKAEPNRAPLRWWDPDDGWKIGTLCKGCAEEFLDAKPKPSDYAFDSTNGVADDIDTDEDPTEAI